MQSLRKCIELLKEHPSIKILVEVEEIANVLANNSIAIDIQFTNKHF